MHATATTAQATTRTLYPQYSTARTYYVRVEFASYAIGKPHGGYPVAVRYYDHTDREIRDTGTPYASEAEAIEAAAQIANDLQDNPLATVFVEGKSETGSILTPVCVNING